MTLSIGAPVAAIDDTARFAGHPVRALLGIARGILAGELLATEGRHAEAVEALQAAVALNDGLAYDEPEAWPLPPRHVLGAVLVDAGRASEAEGVFREDLRRHPANGWALAGLERALRARGDARQADSVARELARVWERADVVVVDARVRPD